MFVFDVKASRKPAKRSTFHLYINGKRARKRKGRKT
jgi:hypothetical protein